MVGTDAHRAREIILNGISDQTMEGVLETLMSSENMQQRKKYLYPVFPAFSQSAVDPWSSYILSTVRGCTNCGTIYEIQTPALITAHQKSSLHCYNCDIDLYPMIPYGEDDTIMQHLEQEAGSISYNENASYQRGCREICPFNPSAKSEDVLVLNDSKIIQHENSRMSKTNFTALRAPVTKEICEYCSNEEAFYTTFQTRSADEGMTVMYECTRCHSRKTFNN